MTIEQHTTSARGGAPSGNSIQFIGNATVLLRYHGFTILTDPTFVHRGEQVPLGYGLTTTRLTDPAMEIEDLPPLDLVVLSHYHGDHFDRVAEERLERSLPIVTTPDAAAKLADKGFTEVLALETWESQEMAMDESHLQITALPGKHAPGALTIAMPPVMGSLLEFFSEAAAGRRMEAEPALRLYITGDTIFYEGLREIPERHPDIDLALLHLGGTKVMGVTVTMDAEQGVELLRTVEPGLAIPIHYNDYDVFKSPLEDFVAAVRHVGLEDRVRYLSHGETFDLAPRGSSG